ncbi:MAG: hypothetical protein Kow0068_10890 [Marinilabiliales bacterium]
MDDRSLKPVPVDVRVIYEILPEGEEAGIARTNPLTGDYKIILPYGKKYGYYALAEGYYSFTRFLDVTDLKEYTEIDEQNIFLAPLKVDQVAILNSIFFKKRTAELEPESYPELNRFVEFLKTNKKIVIELSGHTDNRGDAKENMKLSEERAQAVLQYLEKKGVKTDRIIVKGYGQTRPIGFNSDKEGRERNNRIEFKILSLDKKNYTPVSE